MTACGNASQQLEKCLQKIEKWEGTLRSFLTVDTVGSRARAKSLDSLPKGAMGSLYGCPVGIKDNFCTPYLPTTCASRMLATYQPLHEATAVSRLRAAGAVVVGKTNMDEFGMGSSTENSAFHITRNPWERNSVPGGSSGGSAAAVASGEVCVALGSDTGGSIRQPASFCGVVGLKPTYGRVSRFGLVAFASSLDHVGPITRTVEEAASVLQIIAGKDPRDCTTVPDPVPDYMAALTGDVRGLKLALVEEFLGEGIDDGVRQVIETVSDRLIAMGATVDRVSLPHASYAVATYYILAPAEASSNLARYDGVRFGTRVEGADTLESMYLQTRSRNFGAEVKRRVLLGTYALSAGYYDAYYHKAQQMRTLIQRDFRNLFSQYDALIGPTTPTVAFPLGACKDQPLRMYLSDICTIPASLAGIPAISVPCGFVDGLPVGLQILAPSLAESVVLRVAHAWEQERGPLPELPMGGEDVCRVVRDCHRS
ncbi:Asp-tRNA(Asn)/Glu-tRNA(Gln) amidotransferase subunit GatA [Pasteuria penetrans]|uniref:Asp-tRNA(Asn)/Glu-tRNA(Gln) amidotransferase subunit GatA n=1 Tax=Pasteuria penetrans TaxID=86005 RepID=UPI000FB19E2D|nr:Asp-tRNA(Asn)/Glu-tRNA(Gln) amidotransferase subunit GatA [Pasteuria penetrans]